MKVWIELDFPGLENLLKEQQKELGIPPRKLFSKLQATWYRLNSKGAEGIRFETFCKICDCLNLDAVELLKNRLENILEENILFCENKNFIFFRSIMKR